MLKMNKTIIQKFLIFFILTAFLFSCVNPLRAENLFSLPSPGTMVDLSPAYQPVIVKGLTVHPENPFEFDFIVDTANLNLTEEQLKAESAKLVKYFLASLTVPEKSLWVNLSPYEKDRIIPEALGTTEMGRDMLAQDYILKQLTASLIYPEKALGKSFWSRTYQVAKEKYGTTEIPVNTFNKVWIVPKTATVYEHNGSAFVVAAHLNVMLDEDYLSLQKHLNPYNFGQFRSQNAKQINAAASQIIREVLIPEIKKEVNTGKNFANLRQIYNSMILAIWYKQNLKAALLNQVYSDKAKTKGIDFQDKTFKTKIYAQYLAAFKKGVYNYIKEDVDVLTHQSIPRKYFSGGVVGPREINTIRDGARLGQDDLAMLQAKTGPKMRDVTVDFATIAPATPDVAKPRVRWDDPFKYSTGVIVPTLSALVDYEITDLFIGNGSYPEVTVGKIVRHVQLWPKGEFHNLNRQQMHKALRVLSSYGWMTEKGLEDATDETPYRLTEKGKTALNFVNKYTMVADSIPEYAYITDYVFGRMGRKNIVGLGARAVDLRELENEIRGGWGIKTDDPSLTKSMQDELTGYIIMFLLRGLYLDLELTRGDFNVDSVINELKALEASSKFDPVLLHLLKEMGITSTNDLHSLTNEEKEAKVQDALNAVLKYRGFPELAKAYRAKLSEEDDDVLTTVLGDPKEAERQLTERDRRRLNMSLLKVIFPDAIEDKRGGIFNLFDQNGGITVNQVRQAKHIVGHIDQLEAVFHIFTDVGYLTKEEEGKYKMTASGQRAFTRTQVYGVTVSYSPAFHSYKRILFDASYEPTDSQRVERGDNTISSADNHGAVFDALLPAVKKEEPEADLLRLAKEFGLNPDDLRGMDLGGQYGLRDLPTPENLMAEGRSFSNGLNDTGGGGGAFAVKYAKHVLENTPYGLLVRAHPELYKFVMIVGDINRVARVTAMNNMQAFINKNKQYGDGIVAFTIDADIGEPEDIVKKVQEEVKRRIPNTIDEIRMDHTSTFLLHNRGFVWVKDEDIEKAIAHETPERKKLIWDTINNFKSTAVFGWGDKVITNREFAKNSFLFNYRWAKALRSVGQDQMTTAELFTLNPPMAADYVGAVLSQSYDYTHGASDQFLQLITDFRMFMELAGWIVEEQRNFPTNQPDDLTTNAVFRFKLANAETGVDRASIAQKPNNGGINFDPAMLKFNVRHDGSMPVAFSQALKHMSIDGISLNIIKITNVDVPALLDLPR
jgi:hypothetical protein